MEVDPEAVPEVATTRNRSPEADRSPPGDPGVAGAAVCQTILPSERNPLPSIPTTEINLNCSMFMKKSLSGK